jgi:ABC-type multidrug transport system ATPase subunit
MGLHSCQHTCIGQKFTKSISLGEKKRLSFACELLNNPGIIFCDEPTSGLDAYMAKQVIMCLKQLAKEDGCTVIITIHQPSSQIFEMIDR